MRLNELAPPNGSRKSRKRVGRGVGAGTGKTAGRGSKGQKSRSGGGVRPGFEGGQMPLHRRLPKRGFVNIFKKNYSIINVSDLKKFESGSTVDVAVLLREGLVKGKFDGVKLLGKGEIAYPLTIKLDKVSKQAVKKIEEAGGSIEAV